MTDKEKLLRIKKLADEMYRAAQYLTTDASHLHKAMDEYHQFIVHDYHKEEPVSIWHDASEKADIRKGSIVAINSIGEAAAFNQGSTAIYFMGDYDIERWAYADDLLKL